MGAGAVAGPHRSVRGSRSDRSPVRLAMLSGRNAAAVTYYRELKDRWPNSPCSEGQTGAELFAQASAHSSH